MIFVVERKGCVKILALYLPQFHSIPENDKWWGKGYTEWTAVKNAKPLFANHYQPRIPLDNNYYDLSNNSGKTWFWQAELARKFGIYGFCIYHYWFEGKQLLERPMEILRDHKEIDINYCICWANETWSRNWYAQERTVLLEQRYGDESAWIKHFEYLNTFFRDKRYIKIDNKPVINIYHSQEITCLKEMLECWNRLAIQEGYAGVYIVSGATSKGTDIREELIDAIYEFEPGYVLKNLLNGKDKYQYLFRTGISRLLNRVRKNKLLEHKIDIGMIYKYIENTVLSENVFPGTFPQWDNTPRTGSSGLCYINSSPELFREHLQALRTKYGNRKFLYINAWNEWGEGAYLEPDERYKYEYLQAISDVFEGES